MAITTVTYNSTKDIKKLITDEGIRNKRLKVSIMGYTSGGIVEGIEEGTEYYQVYVQTNFSEFDYPVIDTTSLKKANQRAEQLLNALDGYRGNTTELVEHSGSFECDN